MDRPGRGFARRGRALAGGGTVYLPAGNFLTGTLVLKSNVTLHRST